MRMIDADELKNQIRHMPRTINPDLVQYSLVKAIIENMPTLTPPNEWVSVEERLPNDKQIVLFRQKNGFIYCAEYFAGNSLCSPSWFIDCDCWEAKEVTHWMPLPTPPDRRPPEGEV